MEQRRETISEILDLVSRTETLDIGERVGFTGYIDFINISEIVSPVMHGTDVFGRPFFTVHADLRYIDGTTVPTFTTFFKRYTEQNSMLWHGCGFYKSLIETNGGMNLPQMTFLRDLLKNGTVVFEDGRDDESIQRIRLITYAASAETGHVQYSYVYKRPVSVSLSMPTSLPLM